MVSDPVSELLKEKGVSFTISGKDYVTKCFNPDHNDTNPSFRIDKLTGIAHCFSCGWKLNLFKHYGILTNNVSIKIAKLKKKLKDIYENTNGLDPLEGAYPFSKAYRGISAKTLKHFGAFQTDQLEVMQDRIIFPITDVRNKTVCYVGRRLLSDSAARYANYPAGVTIPVFPVRFPKKYTSIVLVEGIFDMLNLYENGIHNVVCTFGTSKLLNNVEEKLLPFKVAGIEKIFIVYDGDDAGREAANKIKPLIEQEGFYVEIINIPDGSDPGDLDTEIIEQIKEYVK